jgi:hypothetical protein
MSAIAFHKILGKAVMGACFAVMMFGLGSDRASAQSSCVENCRNSGWAQNQCVRYCETRYGEPGRGARVYGYSGRSGSTCGQYYYMRGGKCVDARTTPPN